MKLLIDIPFEAYYTFKCDLEKGNSNLNALGEIIANGKPYEEQCEVCPFKKFTGDMTEKLVNVMVDNGITDFDELAKQCGVSYLHQDSITTTKQ